MVLSKNLIIRTAILICILFLAFTGLSAFTISDVSFSYYVLFGVLFIGLITVLKYKIPPFENKTLVLILLYIIISTLINFATFKFTSVMYSIMFIVYYTYLIYYSKQNLKIESFIWLLKAIIITFFIVLIISQIIVLFDLHTLERPEGYFQSMGELGIQFDHTSQTYRYHSLSTEPSYSAIIILLSFAILRDLTDKREKLIPYILMVLFMLLSFKSAMGFIVFFVWILSQVKITKKQFLIFGVLVFVALILFFFTDLGGKSVGRIREIVFVLFAEPLNFVKNLKILDSSAHARIGPTVSYLQQMDLLNYPAYFGHGAATSEPFFSRIIYPETWNTHMVFRPPFIPGFLYDYGFLGALLVGYFLWQTVSDTNVFFKIAFLLILINSNFNTQLFWFAITVVGIYSYFKNYKLLAVQYSN